LAQTLVGDLKEFNLNDVLQLLGMARQTGALHITHGRGKGVIYMDKGIPVHALTSSTIAENAIYEIFSWSQGRFFFNSDTTNERTIETSLQNIIMESARRIDEWERVRDLIPNLDIVVQFNSSPQQGSKNISLDTSEWQTLSLVDGVRTVRDISSDSNFDEFETCKILYGLLSSGLLVLTEDDKKIDKEKYEKILIPSDFLADVEVAEKGNEEDIERDSGSGTQDKRKKKKKRSGLKFFKKLLKSPSVFQKGSDKTEKKAKVEVYNPVNAAGVLAHFANELLNDYKTPRGLYGAIRLRDPLSVMIKKIAREYPVVAEISLDQDRFNVQEIDTEFLPEKLDTYELLHFFKILLDRIFEDARKSLSPRSAKQRYQEVFSRVFTGDNSIEKLGLEGMIDRRIFS